MAYPSPPRGGRFHGQSNIDVPDFITRDAAVRVDTKRVLIKEREVNYRFHSHQHPYVQQLTRSLLRGGTAALQAADTDYVRSADGSFETLEDGSLRPKLYEDTFDAVYQPDSRYVEQPYPAKELDFSSYSAYSVYNWELFFHVPLTIAIHLSKNQRFADAQRWLHFLFDPTDDSDGSTPERFWKVRPFQQTDIKIIEEILVNLVTGSDEALREETIHSIEAWKDAPFRPHLVARYRHPAYMYKTVMTYLDNLIAWGDSLFRQDTGEAVDEAMMHYVLAANILGPRPQPVPSKGTVRPQTYANLREDVREFGSVMRDLETDLPFDLMPFPAELESDESGMITLRSIGQALYFCVPPNDKLLGYWDTVADRLFKIRNSLNLQGAFRQLALFEPPIDPALLARATASGLNVDAIVNGLNQPLPLVRFRLLVRHALEVVQEVKSLGNSLLSAMEKEDGEALALLRIEHERAVLEMVEHVRYGQVQEATKSRESLLESLASVVQRYSFYERQLGRSADEITQGIPEIDELDAESMVRMRFAMGEPRIESREIEVDIVSSGAADELAQTRLGGKLLSSYEAREAGLLELAQFTTDIANVLNVVSSVSHYVPKFQINVEPMGAGSSVEYGGDNVGDAVGATAAAARAIASRLDFEARRAARIDNFARRERDWAFQSNLAAGEITQIFKQLRAAQIREAVAKLELKVHRKQMTQSEDIEYFMNSDGAYRKGKQSNRSLYAWMKREVRGLYSQSFQLAFDIAKKAERALQHELGDTGLTYLRFGYQAGNEGLLAGEKLYLDVKRMEMAQLDLDRREYELVKHVSLMQLDPLAILRLRTTGECTVMLPEALFDMDGPGHYFRRIKTVAVSVPCVIGPYSSINCTLTLLKSSIRKTQILLDDHYARAGTEDERFSDNYGSLQSIVTSSAQSDSGLFETNLQDERFLPFEKSGVISEWILRLPANPSTGEPTQFDYETISDVILHIRYTARDGGALLRSRSIEYLQSLISSAQAAGSVRLFSVRHEFPTEWARFQNMTPEASERFTLSIELREEHYPFWSRDCLLNVERMEVIARSASRPTPASLDVFDSSDGSAGRITMEADEAMGGLLFGRVVDEGVSMDLLSAPVGRLQLFFDDNATEELWIAVTWGG